MARTKRKSVGESVGKPAAPELERPWRANPWSPKRWAPATARLIQEWGDVLGWLDSRRIGDQPLDPGTTTALQSLIARTGYADSVALADGVVPIKHYWVEFGDAVVAAAGLKSVTSLHAMARWVRFDYGNKRLAEQLLCALDVLAPQFALPARLHHRAFFGDWNRSIEALKALVADETRATATRLYAFQALLDLGAHAGTAGPLAESGRRFGPPWLADTVAGLVERHSPEECDVDGRYH